jgi:hypothetical protein
MMRYYKERGMISCSTSNWQFVQHAVKKEVSTPRSNSIRTYGKITRKRYCKHQANYTTRGVVIVQNQHHHA